jgi:hypothetical protein
MLLWLSWKPDIGGTVARTDTVTSCDCQGHESCTCMQAFGRDNERGRDSIFSLARPAGYVRVVMSMFPLAVLHSC